MSLTFTKLFSSITESTVWMEPAEVRIVWITMLAMADKYGRVWASVPGLANRARVPVETTRKALSCFLSPDPDSRTKEHEGRRIEEIEGGWRLLNYGKYRAVRDDENTREKARIRKQNERLRKKGSRASVTNVTLCHDNAEAEAEADKGIKTSGDGGQELLFSGNGTKSSTKPKNPFAEAFKAAFDGVFPQQYRWTTADFVQIAGWQKAYPAVTPEAFVAVARAHWANPRFQNPQALTIAGLCSKWAQLAASASGIPAPKAKPPGSTETPEERRRRRQSAHAEVRE